MTSKVAEFACDPVKATAAGAFYDSAIPFHPRHLQLEQTLHAADTLRKNAGIILGLFDPVGMAIELSARMHGLLADYLRLKKAQRRRRPQNRRLVQHLAIACRHSGPSRR